MQKKTTIFQENLPTNYLEDQQKGGVIFSFPRWFKDMIVPSNHINLKRYCPKKAIRALFSHYFIPLILLLFTLNNSHAQENHEKLEIQQQDNIELNAITDPETRNSMIIFYFTLAEIAWSRNQTQEALTLYFHALSLSDNPEISEIVTKRFISVNLNQEGLYAVKKWLTAEPTNTEANMIYLILIINTGNTAQTEIILNDLYKGPEKDFTKSSSFRMRHKQRTRMSSRKKSPRSRKKSPRRRKKTSRFKS